MKQTFAIQFINKKDFDSAVKTLHEYKAESDEIYQSDHPCFYEIAENDMIVRFVNEFSFNCWIETFAKNQFVILDNK